MMSAAADRVRNESNWIAENRGADDDEKRKNYPIFLIDFYSSAQALSHECRSC